MRRKEDRDSVKEPRSPSVLFGSGIPPATLFGRTGAWSFKQAHKLAVALLLHLFVSCLPLSLNKIRIQRGLTTSSTAIFIPFTSQELFQSGGEALYCGLNALSHNLIMVDRKKLKNPNGLILGTPGSGKSFSAKREIANVFLVTDDDIIICDPEAEYGPLVEHLHGQVIKISPTSKDYILSLIHI